MIATAIEALPGLPVAVFLVFCRIGSCLMLVPGYGSARVPVQVRLLLSIGANAAIFSLAPPFEGKPMVLPALPELARLSAIETSKGVFIGFMARFFFAALQFVAVAAASAIGLNSSEPSAEDGEQQPALTSLVTITATALFFIADQHLEILRALVQSYGVLGFGAAMGDETRLPDLIWVLGSASLLALQLCSPLLVYAIIVNRLFGILNKFSPQIPVFFISPPFTVGGGLMLLYLLANDLFAIFIARFSDWLASG
jgi:flagellar biosynthesis protein FliR